MKTYTCSRAGLIALLSAAALTLTACGGNSDSSDKDKIDGAEGKTKSASPSTSPTSDGIDRPKITLPKDVHNVFEDQKTGDPKKDAVLADNASRINSVDEAITGGDTARPALKFYSKGRSLASAITYIQSFIDDGSTFVGTTRYFDREVTFLKDGAAAVSYCSDESKTNNKKLKSDKVKPNTAGQKNFIRYNTRLEKNKSGVWQTALVTSTAGAKECRS